ncbi:MAG: hypothetical protein ACD_67C00061G0001 [uncultured bacterium]|nr:MAG: hypothetical protein ACD_67C00061G0001 [uncultured bacterium]
MTGNPRSILIEKHDQIRSQIDHKKYCADNKDFIAHDHILTSFHISGKKIDLEFLLFLAPAVNIEKTIDQKTYMKENLKSFSDLMKTRVVQKAPAHQWQDLALKVIQELNVPNEKRNSVFRVCKQYSRPVVERAMNDTKELCKTGQQWSYFFKIIGKTSENPNIKKQS